MDQSILTIYTYNDGVNDEIFLDAENPVTISEYTFSAQRMGSVSLSATLMYSKCLDNYWNGKQYITFKGDRFFLKNIPSSEKNNEDARYKHTLEFISERELQLNNVYFFDAVSEDTPVDDKYQSNSTNLQFNGTIYEFAKRLQASLNYSGLTQYKVIVDDGITSDSKDISFSDLTIFEALQEGYNVYDIPFYFINKDIHWGNGTNVIDHVFQYGVDNELLSIQKNNANYKIITSCTGTGSSENIPYYYPNNSPKGNVDVEVGEENQSIQKYNIKIINHNALATRLDFNQIVLYVSTGFNPSQIFVHTNDEQINPYTDNTPFTVNINFDEDISTRPDTRVTSSTRIGRFTYYIQFKSDYGGYYTLTPQITSNNFRYADGTAATGIVSNENVIEKVTLSNLLDFSGTTIYNNTSGESYPKSISFKTLESARYLIAVDCYVKLTAFTPQPEDNIYCDVSMGVEKSYQGYWGIIKPGEGLIEVDLKDIGIEINTSPSPSDYFYMVLLNKLPVSSNLLPTIYRSSNGKTRFYKAYNLTYRNPETQEYYEFENEYNPLAPKEHIQAFEDIKPTIQGITNAAGQEIGQFLDIAYDEDDNDDMDSEGNYLHPYFFVKLPKFDGTWGFNLFDHAIENGEMSLSMINGNCGACKFVIGVDDELQKNTVQVDENGDLMRDSEGNVLLGQWQEKQNDTINNEVWIALKKDIETFGVIMPNATNNYKPNIGDNFVILNILLPQVYITNAENRLKEAIIKYMYENNSDKFNFSIKFSRIFLEENLDIKQQLNENSQIQIAYNNVVYPFFISQYTYKTTEDDALPEIDVELSETVTINRGTLWNELNSLQNYIINNIQGINNLTQYSKYFLRKDIDDSTNKSIAFRKGLTFGNYIAGSKGGAVTVDSNGNTTAEFDFLTVRNKTVESYGSSEKINPFDGQFIMSRASMICNKVETTEQYIRCYFNNNSEDSNTILNTFAVDDQVICQTFNQNINRYYWRLVISVGSNYIDLSNTDSALNSQIPIIGDNIVQLGNRTNVNRQSAIIFDTKNQGAPSLKRYEGINSYTLDGREVSGDVFDDINGLSTAFNYGKQYNGDREGYGNPNAENINYVAFEQREGDTKKQLYIQAKMVSGSLLCMPPQVVKANATINSNSNFIIVESSNPISLTLPENDLYDGRIIYIKKVKSNDVSVKGRLLINSQNNVQVLNSTHNIMVEKDSTSLIYSTYYNCWIENN